MNSVPKANKSQHSIRNKVEEQHFTFASSENTIHTHH